MEIKIPRLPFVPFWFEREKFRFEEDFRIFGEASRLGYKRSFFGQKLKREKSRGGSSRAER